VDGGGGGGGGRSGEPHQESNQELLSASEQRQWQRLQRQFDTPDNARQETVDDAREGDFTLPYSPDCSHA